MWPINITFAKKRVQKMNVISRSSKDIGRLCSDAFEGRRYRIQKEDCPTYKSDKEMRAKIDTDTPRLSAVGKCKAWYVYLYILKLSMYVYTVATRRARESRVNVGWVLRQGEQVVRIREVRGVGWVR